MEKVTDQSEIEVYESDIDMYLRLFCEQRTPPIEDMSKEPQSVWNACLRYIYKHVFKDNNIFKDNNTVVNNNNSIKSNYNRYNYDKILNVLDIYIYNMCMQYDKEVSIIGFSSLTGIDASLIQDWGVNDRKLSPLSFEIYKKLKVFREESLSNKLVTGNKNPVGILGVLNRHYQWNLPGVSREKANNAALPMSELPQLGANNGSFGQLEDNNSIVDSNTNG